MKIKKFIGFGDYFFGQIFVCAQTEKAIAAIRAEVVLINASSNKYSKKTRNIENLSLEGTEATYFLAGKTVVKIAAKLYGETFNAVAEIYYKDGQPIFIFYKLSKYAAPIGSSKQPKIAGSEEQRIYFSGGKPLKIMIGKNTLQPANARFPEIERSLTELSENLTASLQKAGIN